MIKKRVLDLIEEINKRLDEILEKLQNELDRVGKIYPTRFVGLSMEAFLGCCASYWGNLSFLCGVMIDVGSSVFL